MASRPAPGKRRPRPMFRSHDLNRAPAPPQGRLLVFSRVRGGYSRRARDALARAPSRRDIARREIGARFRGPQKKLISGGVRRRGSPVIPCYCIYVFPASIIAGIAIDSNGVFVSDGGDVRSSGAGRRAVGLRRRKRNGLRPCRVQPHRDTALSSFALSFPVSAPKRTQNTSAMARTHP